MIFIGKYNEFNPGQNYPSIKDFFSKTPYAGQDRVIHYLMNGDEDMASLKVHKDVITGKSIPMSVIGMNDGEYSWFNTLAYYVENYNLRLPEDFEKKILDS